MLISTPTEETVYAGPPIPPVPLKVGEVPDADLATAEANVRRFLVNVFGFMVVALGVSALFAAYVDQYRESLNSSLASQLIYLLVGGLLLAAGFISHHIEKMPASVAIATLLGYSASQGALLGFVYRSAYSESLAPVYIGIALVFACMSAYGLSFGVDLTWVRSLLIGSGVALLVSYVMQTEIGISVVAAVTIFVVSVLMLALAGFHRDFLRDLPDSFDNDPGSLKAAAVGALQIYLDLIVIVIVIIQARWIQSAIDDDRSQELEKFKP